VITNAGNWHWIFWLNLPVLGIVFICVLVAMSAGGPDLRGENCYKPWLEELASLDWLGTSLLILTMTTLILALQFSQLDTWSSPKVLVMSILSGLSFIALIVQQSTTLKEKIFDPEIISIRSVWSTRGLFFSLLSSVGILILFLPFLLQVGSSQSPFCHHITHFIAAYQRCLSKT
jgi:hypothetical protein